MFNNYIRNKLTIKRMALYSLTVPICVAVYQGHKMRKEWLATGKLQPPSGTSGIEKWVEKIKTLASEKEDLVIIANLDKLFSNILDKVKQNRELSDGTNNREEDNEFIKNKIKIWMNNIYSILGHKITHSATNCNPAPSSSSRSSSSSTSSKATGFYHHHYLFTNHSPKSKKIKLVIIGDSLAAGVGCDEDDKVPVLVKVLAKTLSLTLGADIEWRVAGIVGGTVPRLRHELIPALKSDFLVFDNDDIAKKENENTRVIAVIICGLNDWRTMLESFPFGRGPESFRSDLNGLISDLQKDLPPSVKCNIFLPSIPLSLASTDPKSLFTRKPVSYLIDFVNRRWDDQKQDIVSELDNHHTMTYVDTPPLSSLYATPGRGTISVDGVHPSSEGYQWWALHIAEAILASELQRKDK